MGDDCTDSQVRRYAKQGKTISWIAGHCDRDEQDVADIISASDGRGGRGSDQRIDDGRRPSGIASGSPVAPCGCYGFAMPGQIGTQPMCQSGYAVAQMCGGFCPGGGAMWTPVCR